jgi:hypothetical protein
MSIYVILLQNATRAIHPMYIVQSLCIRSRAAPECVAVAEVLAPAADAETVSGAEVGWEPEPVVEVIRGGLKEKGVRVERAEVEVGWMKKYLEEES